MTSSLVYLLSRRLKNNVKALVRSPVRLIYTLLMVALFGFVIFTGNFTDVHSPELRSSNELLLIISAFFTFMFLIVAYNGFNDGASIFKLADVNLLFAAPFTPRRVLFYGLIQQLSSSLMLGFFIFFQYSWLKTSYGVEVWGLFVLLGGYALILFCAQLASMIIYSLSTSGKTSKIVAKCVFYGLVSILAAWLVTLVIQFRDNIFEALPVAAASPILRFFPVSGWLGSAVVGVITGDFSLALPGIILAVLGISACIAVVFIIRPDFYEDAINTAEKVQSQKADAAAGKLRDWSPKRVKIKTSGLGGGFGASAFFYKHKLENRRSRVLLVDKSSLIFAGVTILYSFAMRKSGLVSVLGFSVYMQIFSVALGRFVKELVKPYIFLVPEPAMKKLLWNLRESLGSFAVDAIITAIPSGLILGLGVLEILAFFLVRMSFSLLLLAANLACEHVFGSVTTKALIMTFYFLTVLLMAAPGIALAVFLGVTGAILLSLEFTICLALTFVNIPITLLVLFLCRDILDYAQLNS